MKAWKLFYYVTALWLTTFFLAVWHLIHHQIEESFMMFALTLCFGIIGAMSIPSDSCKPNRTPRTFDLTGGRRGWGNDITYKPVNNGLQLTASGWLRPLPQNGDWIILLNGDSSTRYRFENVRHLYNPPDMWHATLVFDPRPWKEER